MRTKVEFQGDYTIVQVSGRLDIDKTSLFKQACLASLKGQKVIFALESLNFVGSTGILNFFHAINEIHELNNRTCRIAGLSNDFRRVVHLVDFQSLELHETVDMATLSFERPVVPVMIESVAVINENLLTETQAVAVELTSSEALIVGELEERNS
ncbi:MAG: STAS domain-containing protein [Bdellovibrionota bacterium]